MSFLKEFGDFINIATETNKKVDKFLAKRKYNKYRKELTRQFGVTIANEIIEAANNGANFDALVNAYQKKQVALSNPPPLHGSSKWATWQDLKGDGLLECWDSMVYQKHSKVALGAFLNPDEQLRKREDNWLYWGGESHLMTLAPSGAGKSTLQLIPNLLQYHGSCVVFDPKGELYESTSSYRNKIGKVFRLAPFEKNTDAFNPIDAIKSMDDAIQFASIIYPEESKGDAAFYEKEARSFLAAIIYFVAEVGGKEDSNMDKIYEITTYGDAEFAKLADDLAKAKTLPEPIRANARLVKDFELRTRTTLRRSLNEKLSIWSSQALSRATKRSDFQFTDLKHETVTVYITVPFDKIQTYSYYVQSVLTSALESMIQEKRRPAQPILFILDEFLSLGQFPRFVSALRTHRDAGVRLWFILQNISDLQEMYPESWKSFFSQTAVKSIYGTRDHYTAELITQMLGQRTIAYESTPGISIQSNDNNTSTSLSDGNVQYMGRSLLDPREVQTFLGKADPNGTRFAITEFSGMPPVRGILPPWYADECFRRRFGSKDGLFPSPLLSRMFDILNDVYYGNCLPTPMIGYLDYSMGRDGFMPLLRDEDASYDMLVGRLIFVAAVRPIELLLLQAKKEGNEDLAAHLQLYLEFAMIREMRHIYMQVHRKHDTGLTPNGSYEEHLTSVDRDICDIARTIGYEFPTPSIDLAYEWPCPPPLSEIITELGDRYAALSEESLSSIRSAT